MLQLREPLDDLAQVDDALAEELKQTTSNIQRRAELSTSRRQPFNDPSKDGQDQEYRRLVDHWDALVAKARSLAEFQDFLQPRRFMHLLPSAIANTVVVIYVHSSRCDALAFRQHTLETLHIPLPDFCASKAASVLDKLLLALAGSNSRSRNDRGVYRNKQTHVKLQDVLSALWTDVALPIIEALGYTHSTGGTEELPRITWCTTGTLSLLPLHAAGSYHEPNSSMCDYVISSYTPNLSALLRPCSKPSEFHGILAVGQAGGGAPLPETVTEINHIYAHDTLRPFTRLANENATVDAVLDAIEKHSWVHLACHASQDLVDPSSSAFKLYDGDLPLSRITQKPLPHSDFAFLSACETAMGDRELPDEVIHLAAGMLTAGFSGVIATMWSIKDKDAPFVAKVVYDNMFETGIPDSSRTTVALHQAVQVLRGRIGTSEFHRWVPYIHVVL